MDLTRIRTDFQLALTTLFAAVTSLGVLPFAIYRLSQGQLLVAAVEIALVMSIVAACVHGWGGGNVERLSQVMVVVYTAGCVVVAHLLPRVGPMWMYPVLLANFMLVQPRFAAAVSMAGVVALLLSPVVFTGMQARLVFLVTASVACLFAFIFAFRSNAQRQQLEELASHDTLTGIHNRRTLEREIGIAIEAFRRHHTPYGLAMVDLDHFKRINDTFGHEAGDRVLVEFTAMVNRITRRGDRFFRFGGEEFVLLLPGADADALGVFCEHLRQSAGAELHCGNQVVTVSIGAAALRRGEDAVSWLARADDATYEAKRRGRDCVVIAAGVASRGDARGATEEQEAIDAGFTLARRSNAAPGARAHT